MLFLFKFQNKQTNKTKPKKEQQQLISTKELKKFQNLATHSTFYMMLTDFVSQYKSQSTWKAWQIHVTFYNSQI